MAKFSKEEENQSFCADDEKEGKLDCKGKKCPVFAMQAGLLKGKPQSMGIAPTPHPPK